MLHVSAHAFGRHAMDVDQFMVVAVDEVPLHVEHIGKAAGESGAEIHSRAPQHTDHSARHVLAAVIARALHHGQSAGIAHGKALSGGARGIQFAAGGAVQAGIAHDDRLTRHEVRARGRLQDDFARCHALAHIVVGLALEMQMQSAGIPHAEALAGGTLQSDDERRLAHAGVPPALGDFAGNTRADGPVKIVDRVGEPAPGFRGYRRLHVAEHLLAQHALVEGLVMRIDAVLRFAGHQRGIGQHRRQIELALPRCLPRQNFQQFRASDQFGEVAHAQGRHDFAAFLRHELEVVDHHVGQPDEVLGAQHIVLRRHARRAIVQVADAQVLAAQGDHGRGAETEALGADEGRLDHIETRLQAAVGLQADPMPQLIGAQGLMRLGQAQFPGRTGVLDGRQRARARAAVVAADGDQIRVGLGDPRRNGAHAGLRHQFDRHQCAWIDLLQIEDQLRQILDGVDVVMRGR